MAEGKTYNGNYCEYDFEVTFIEKLVEAGWTYMSGKAMNSAAKDEVVYADDLLTFLKNTNPELTVDEIGTIYDKVRLVGGSSEFTTLHNVYNWMVDGIQFMPNDGNAKIVQLIDFEHPEENIFRVVNQYSNTSTTVNAKPADRISCFSSTACPCAFSSLKTPVMPKRPSMMPGSR